MARNTAPAPQPAGRLTFYRNPQATGLSRAAEPHPDVDVRIGGLQVGLIRGPRPLDRESEWTVLLSVADSTERSGWRWTRLRGRWPTEHAARGFWLNNRAKICAAHQLQQQED